MAMATSALSSHARVPWQRSRMARIGNTMAASAQWSATQLTQIRSAKKDRRAKPSQQDSRQARQTLRRKGSDRGAPRTLALGSEM